MSKGLKYGLPGKIDLTSLRDRERRCAGQATEAEAKIIASEAGIVGISELTFTLETKPWRKGILVEGFVSATVVQECVATLEPVSTELDEPIKRGFVPPTQLFDDAKAGLEIEIEDDFELGDPPEPLEDPLNLDDVILDAIVLALPAYPRAQGAEPVEITAEPSGAAPITEAEVKPFAELKALRDKMSGQDT